MSEIGKHMITRRPSSCQRQPAKKNVGNVCASSRVFSLSVAPGACEATADAGVVMQTYCRIRACPETNAALYLAERVYPVAGCRPRFHSLFDNAAIRCPYWCGFSWTVCRTRVARVMG